MKNALLILTVALACLQLETLAAEPNAPVAPEPPAKHSVFSDISVSPYGTVAFHDFDGKSRTGWGVEAGLPLSKSVSAFAFTETDNTAHSTFDRTGAGIRVTGRLTKSVSLFGGMGVGYSFDGGVTGADDWFLRPQFGAALDLYKSKLVDVDLVGSWGLDVDKNGNSAQRLSAGLKFSF